MGWGGAHMWTVRSVEAFGNVEYCEQGNQVVRGFVGCVGIYLTVWGIVGLRAFSII